MTNLIRRSGALQRHGIILSIVLLPSVLLRAAEPRNQPTAATLARKILQITEVQGGLVVHLGCGDGKLTAALGALRGYLVQGLDRDRGNVRQARENLQNADVYGSVSIDHLAGERLPYADDLVNLVVVEDLGAVTMDEVLRVLTPGGVVYTRQRTDWTKTTKPWSKEIDDWTHYLHDASGNAVADDVRVGPPKHVRWIAKPYWARSHEFNPSLNAAVSGDGRLFYTLDEGLAGVTDSPEYRFPARWSLIARDAFNGVLLWKRQIPNWGFREWNTVGMWSAPLTLQRRLVTDGDRVFMTLGYDAAVSILDAATGEELGTIAETKGTDEMILADGVLLLCVRKQLSVASPPDPKDKPKRRLNTREWNVSAPGPAAIVAVDAASGEILWKRDPQPVTILTLAAHNGRVCYHGEEDCLVCLDLKTGRQQWQTACRVPKGSRHSGGTLVMHDEVVLFTGAEGLSAFSAGNGEKLWTGPKHQGPGVAHPPDLFVANGLVWSGHVAGSHRREQTSVRREGRDPKTGDVKRTIEVPHLISPLHHFRCYRSKATDRFLLLTKRGVEYVDLEAEDHMRHDWLRAGCSYGFLPCNGLLYATPHHCFCYPAAKLNGFLALAAPGALEANKPKADDVSRLQRGAAYEEIQNLKSAPANSAAWPTYRHDAARSGHSKTAVSTDLKQAWQITLGGRLTQPVIADGKALIAQVDAHIVHALDADTGAKLWSYTAGARVDSPPTVHNGLVLFGCRDGWVYCLRADDGQLAWRFRAAPQDQRIVVFNQLESPWPVPGSVLVQNGVAYVSAGRSSFLDGGVFLYGLDPKSGRLICRTRVEGPWSDPETDVGRPFDMEGTKGDILVGDGIYLYLYQMVFDGQLQQQDAPRMSNLGDRRVGLHLMSTGGLVDYEWYDRTFWTYSRRWPGFYYANAAPKAGQILVFDDNRTYGLHVFTRRDRLSPAFTPGRGGYELFADDNDNEPVLSPKTINREKGPGFSAQEPIWSKMIPVRVRGMVLADETLFLAGPPDEVPADDPYAAFDGRLGAKLWAVSVTDGTRLAAHDLPHEPVFDGMVAAAGRLYIATSNGKLLCYEETPR